MMSLNALVRATREGLPGAQARLNDAVRARLKSYFSTWHNSEDAKDLIQNAMLIVFEKFDRLEPAVSFERWLLGVARNVALREHLSQARYERLQDALEQLPFTPRTGPSTALRRAELAELLSEEIRQLPDHLRTVLEHYLADGDARALADELGISPITVRTRRKRAIDQLDVRTDDHSKTPTPYVSKLTHSSTPQRT